ncbi:hypothetical protein DDE82_001118 [Stemphylium lycopersici]|nr:hypothetical protein DDE82_001118 [Stemphylium lycopersici]
MKDHPEVALVTAGRDVRTDARIPSNTNHETAVKAQSKPKRRTKTYRVIQRPDGVVIERPRYRPSDLHQKPGNKVDGDRAGSNNIILAGGTEEERLTRLDYDLLGIGSSTSDTGGGGNGEFAAEEGTYVVAQLQEPTRGVTDIEIPRVEDIPLWRFYLSSMPYYGRFHTVVCSQGSFFAKLVPLMNRSRISQINLVVALQRHSMAPSRLSMSGGRKRRVPSPGIKSAYLPRETTISEGAFKEEQHGYEDNAGAAPSQGKVTSTHGAKGSLTCLPSELIDLIASHLRNSKSVFSFGSVNKRFHGIVRQAIVRDLVLGRGKIKGFLEMLGHHPELMRKVTSANLGDFSCSRHEECTCLGIPTLDADVMEVIRRTMDANSDNGVDWTNIQEDRRRRGSVWRINQAFFLNMLAALCPNIRSMEIQLPEARQCQVSQPPRPLHIAPHVFPSLNPELLPVTPFQGSALHILGRTLHSLTIAEDTRWKGPATLEVLHSHDLKWRNMGRYIITLEGFTSLKRLDVPMEVLGRPDNIVFSPPSYQSPQGESVMNTKTGPIEDKKLKTLEEARSKILPFTMTHMYLRSCNKWTFGILRKVNEIPTENLQLRHIELFFKTEPQQAIMQCDSAEDGRINYLQLLTDLERKNVSISFYFGVKEVRIDMHRELAALRLLSPFEIWHFSGFRRPFSDLDRTASKGRRLSLIGSRLFLRYSASHLQLLNRPTFNPASWAQTAFFQGNKGAKRYQSSNDLRPKARVEDSSSAKDRALGRRNFRRRLAPLLDIDAFQFSFRFGQRSLSLPEEATRLDMVFRVPSVAPVQPEDFMIMDETPGPERYESSQPKRIGRTSLKEPKNSQVKELENDMVDLEIGPVTSIATSEEVAWSQPAFDMATWATMFDWKTLLSTEEIESSVFGRLPFLVAAFRRLVPTPHHYNKPCELSPIQRNSLEKMFPPFQFSCSHRPSPIGRLPNELLLNIAAQITHLDRNWDLANLALVSKRWRAVAQEWLLKEPRFHVHFMQRYMCEVRKRQELLVQVKTVEIWSNSQELKERQKNHSERKHGSSSAIRPKSYLSISAPECMTRDADFMETCTEIIERKSSNAEDQEDWNSALETDVIPSLFSVLLCMLPNLRELKLSDAWMIDFPFLTTALSASATQNIIMPLDWAGKRGYQSDAIAALFTRLTVLEIPTDMTAMCFSRGIAMPFDFRNFSNLREVAITMRAISLFIPLGTHAGPIDPREMFPKTLELLRITEASYATANFLNQTCLSKKTGHFPHVRRVEVYHMESLNDTVAESEEARCPHPVKDVHIMCADAEIALYLYFPPWIMKSWESGGGAPWRLKAESERLRRAEQKCYDIDMEPFDMKYVMWDRFEAEWDADGDLVMV